MRGTRVKSLRKYCYAKWVEIAGDKVPFKRMFRRVKRAYNRGLVLIDRRVVQ